MIPPIPSVQRLRRGLQGYLIPFAPHAFEHERQFLSSKLPSPSVFLPISAHFPPALPLRPVNPSNARSLRITAAAGTELATTSSHS